jgi:superfamily I DNA/RNA helicase
MHRCKGREFDYVVMVVDPRAHKADADIGELRRLHYVAATRAKQWLGVVYVRNDVGSVLQPVLYGI